MKNGHKYKMHTCCKQHGACTLCAASAQSCCQGLYFHTNRCYGLPIFVMGEAKQFYPEEWAEIENLRKYKLDSLNELLKCAKKEGILKSDVHFGILIAMLERSSEIILDTDFLLENKLHVAQAIDAVLDIILYGIEKENKDDN